MDLTTTIKYLEFVSAECERLLEDGRVTDDELYQLIIEFNRFQDNIASSEIPDELKGSIQEIKFTYTPKKLKRNLLFMVTTLLTIGAWAYVIEMRRQVVRKETLVGLKNTTTTLAYSIRLNY